MSEIAYINWSSVSDKAIAQRIGAFVKHHRIEQNKTQDFLASAAGISRSTLSVLEHGEAVTLPTLIQVLRTLDQLQVMELFWIQPSISPLVMAKMEKYKRKRASGKNNDLQ